MRTSELGFLPPFLVDRRMSRAARLNEGFDKSCGRGGGGIERESREDKWGGETAGAYLMGCNVDETTDVLESKDDVTFVGEVTIILGDFVLWDVEARRV
jgi:hypothetical protein